MIILISICFPFQALLGFSHRPRFLNVVSFFGFVDFSFFVIFPFASQTMDEDTSVNDAEPMEAKQSTPKPISDDRNPTKKENTSKKSESTSNLREKHY